MAQPATLPLLLEATASRWPTAPALPGMGWAEVARAVCRLAGGLARQGIGRGDRVALFLPNRPGMLLLLLALARRGACAVLLNTRFRAAELGPLLARAKPSAIAVAPDFAPVDAASVLAEVPAEARESLRFVIGVGGVPAHGAPPSPNPSDALGVEPPVGGEGLAGLPMVRLDALADGPEAPDVATPGDDCLTFTTSGTTAGPKLVLHRQRSIAAHAAAVAVRIGLAPGAALLAAIPLCGTFGLAAAMAALAGGAAIHPMERFDAAAADALVRRERITHLVGGDDMLLSLAEAAGGRPYAPLAFTGFANFNGQAAAVMAASARLNLAARGVYGSSEAQALFALQDPAGGHAAVGGGIPASAEAGFRVAADGELLLRGPSLFDRYLGDADATARARTEDGWFRSGDLATAQPDGRGFDFATRAGDALRLGGFLVAPEEIEGFLLSQPGVQGAQVVAHEGRAVGFVIPGAGYDEAALLAACGARLARFKVPARIVALEAFPTTDGPNGRKVQRARLRDMAAA